MSEVLQLHPVQEQFFAEEAFAAQQEAAVAPTPIEAAVDSGNIIALRDLVSNVMRATGFRLHDKGLIQDADAYDETTRALIMAKTKTDEFDYITRRRTEDRQRVAGRVGLIAA